MRESGSGWIGCRGFTRPHDTIVMRGSLRPFNLRNHPQIYEKLIQEPERCFKIIAFK
jgi:hypothetical protein